MERNFMQKYTREAAAVGVVFKYCFVILTIGARVYLCQNGNVDYFADTECDDGLFGDNCTQVCMCHNVSEVCNKSVGYCESGCRVGRMPPDCQGELFPDTNGSSNIAYIIVGSSLGLVLAIGIAIAYTHYKYKRAKRLHSRRSSTRSRLHLQQSRSFTASRRSLNSCMSSRRGSGASRTESLRLQQLRESGRPGCLPPEPKPLDFHDIIAAETVERERKRAELKKQRLSEDRKENTFQDQVVSALQGQGESRVQERRGSSVGEREAKPKGHRSKIHSQSASPSKLRSSASPTPTPPGTHAHRQHGQSQRQPRQNKSAKNLDVDVSSVASSPSSSTKLSTKHRRKKRPATTSRSAHRKHSAHGKRRKSRKYMSDDEEYMDA